MWLVFDREPSLRDFIEFRRREIFAILGEAVPYAELHHVGSTAVPGGWTSGDVDVQVRVDTARFAPATKEIEARFDRGDGGAPKLAVFKHEGRGVCILVTEKESDRDVMHKHRDLLREQPLLRERYDAIKRRFQRGDAAAYAVAKDAFWAEWTREAQAAYLRRLSLRR